MEQAQPTLRTAESGMCHPGRLRMGSARCAPARPARPGALARALHRGRGAWVLALAALAAPGAPARRQEPPQRTPPPPQRRPVGRPARCRRAPRRATRGERGGNSTSEGSPVIDHRMPIRTDCVEHHSPLRLRLRCRLREREAPKHELCQPRESREHRPRRPRRLRPDRRYGRGGEPPPESQGDEHGGDRGAILHGSLTGKGNRRRR